MKEFKITGYFDKIFQSRISIGVCAKALAGCKTSTEQMISRPNILLIMANGMGYSDIECYGGEIPTPNLDKLETCFGKRRLGVIILNFAALLIMSGKVAATDTIPQGTRVWPQSEKFMVYKQADTTSLKLFLYYPTEKTHNEHHAAIVFFFGGGWNGGNITQFEPHAKYFASQGMVAILADYRVRERHGTTPFDAVSDAKSVFRYLRQNAASLGIDPDRIAGAGGSAGGHIAAAAAMTPGLDDPADDLSVSPRPDALVLFNPVFDNGPDGYGFERIGDRYREISPIHNIKPGNPPTIVFLGTIDRLIPVSTAETYRDQMIATGNICQLFLYEGKGHGFFNFSHTESYLETLAQAERFLASLGYIKQEIE